MANQIDASHYGLSAIFSFNFEEGTEAKMKSAITQLGGIEQAIADTSKAVSSSNLGGIINSDARRINTGASKIGHGLDKVRSASKTTRSQLAPLKDEFRALRAAAGNINFGGVTNTRKYSQAIKSAKQYIEQLKEIQLQVKGETALEREFTETLKRQQSVMNFRLELQDASRDAAAAAERISQFEALGVISEKALTPLMEAGQKATEIFAGFDDTMSAVAAISGATGKELEALRLQAKYLGATTRFTAAEAAQAETALASAGFNASQILAGTADTLNLASAGALGLEEAANIAAKTMSGMSLEVSDLGHVSDVLAFAAAAANTNIQELGVAMTYAAPNAALFGATVDETAAILGVMSNSGVNADKAGTALRSAFLRLAGPTAKGQAALDEFGISLSDDSGKMRNIIDVFNELSTKLQISPESLASIQDAGDDVDKLEEIVSQSKQISSLKNIFGTTGISGAAAALSQVKELTRLSVAARAASVPTEQLTQYFTQIKGLKLTEGEDIFAEIIKTAPDYQSAIQMIDQANVDLTNSALKTLDSKELQSLKDYFKIAPKDDLLTEIIKRSPDASRGIANLNSVMQELGIQIEGRTGAAKVMANIMEDNLAGSFRSLSSAIEALYIAYLEPMAPIIRGIIGVLTKLALFFANLPTPVRTVISTIITLTTVVAALSSVVAVAGVILMNYSKSLAITVAASGALAQASIPLTGFFETSVDAFVGTSPIASGVKTYQTSLLDLRKAFLSTGGDAVSVLEGLCASFKKTTVALKLLATEFLLSPWGIAISGFILLNTVLEQLIPGFNLLGTILSVPAAAIGFLFGFVKGLTESFLELMGVLGSGALAPIAPLFYTITNAINDATKAFIDFADKGESLGNAIGNALIEVFRQVGRTITNIWQSMIKAIQAPLLPFVQFVQSIGQMLVSRLAENSPGPTFLIREKWQMTVEFVQALFEKLKKGAILLNQAFSGIGEVTAEERASARMELLQNAANAVIATVQQIAKLGTLWQWVQTFEKAAIHATLENLDLFGFMLLTFSSLPMTLALMIKEGAEEIIPELGWLAKHGIPRAIAFALPAAIAYAIESGAIQGFEEGFSNFLDTIPGRLKSFGAKIYASIDEGLKQEINKGLSEAITNLVVSIPSLFPAGQDFKFTFDLDEAYASFNKFIDGPLVKFISYLHLIGNATADVSKKINEMLAPLITWQPVQFLIPIVPLLTVFTPLKEAIHELTESPALKGIFDFLIKTVLPTIFISLKAIASVISYILKITFLAPVASALDTVLRKLKLTTNYLVEIFFLIKELGFVGALKVLGSAFNKFIVANVVKALISLSEYVKTLSIIVGHLVSRIPIIGRILYQVTNLIGSGLSALFKFAAESFPKYFELLVKWLPIDEILAVLPAYMNVFRQMGAGLVYAFEQGFAPIVSVIAYLLNPLNLLSTPFALLSKYLQTGGFVSILDTSIKPGIIGAFMGAFKALNALNPLDIIFSPATPIFNLVTPHLIELFKFFTGKQFPVDIIDKKQGVILERMVSLMKRADLLIKSGRLNAMGITTNFTVMGHEIEGLIPSIIKFLMYVSPMVQIIGGMSLGLFTIYSILKPLNEDIYTSIASVELLGFQFSGLIPILRLLRFTVVNFTDALLWTLPRIPGMVKAVLTVFNTLGTIVEVTIHQIVGMISIFGNIIKASVINPLLTIPLALLATIDATLIILRAGFQLLKIKTIQYGDAIAAAIRGNFLPLFKQLLNDILLSPLNIINIIYTHTIGKVLATISWMVKETGKEIIRFLQNPIGETQRLVNLLAETVTKVLNQALDTLIKVIKQLQLDKLVELAKTYWLVTILVVQAIIFWAAKLNPVIGLMTVLIDVGVFLFQEYTNGFQTLNALIDGLSHPIAILNKMIESIVGFFNLYIPPEMTDFIAKIAGGFVKALPLITTAAIVIAWAIKGSIGGAFDFLISKVTNFIAHILNVVSAIHSLGSSVAKVATSAKAQVAIAGAVHEVRSKATLARIKNPLAYSTNQEQQERAAYLGEQQVKTAQAALKYQEQYTEIKKRENKRLQQEMIEQAKRGDESLMDQAFRFYAPGPGGVSEGMSGARVATRKKKIFGIETGIDEHYVTEVGKQYLGRVADADEDRQDRLRRDAANTSGLGDVLRQYHDNVGTKDESKRLEILAHGKDQVIIDLLRKFTDAIASLHDEKIYKQQVDQLFVAKYMGQGKNVPSNQAINTEAFDSRMKTFIKVAEASNKVTNETEKAILNNFKNLNLTDIVKRIRETVFATNHPNKMGVIGGYTDKLSELTSQLLSPQVADTYKQRFGNANETNFDKIVNDLMNDITHQIVHSQNLQASDKAGRFNDFSEVNTEALEKANGFINGVPVLTEPLQILAGGVSNIINNAQESITDIGQSADANSKSLKEILFNATGIPQILKYFHDTKQMFIRFEFLNKKLTVLARKQKRQEAATLLVRQRGIQAILENMGEQISLDPKLAKVDLEKALTNKGATARDKNYLTTFLDTGKFKRNAEQKEIDALLKGFSTQKFGDNQQGITEFLSKLKAVNITGKGKGAAIELLKKYVKYGSGNIAGAISDDDLKSLKDSLGNIGVTEDVLTKMRDTLRDYGPALDSLLNKGFVDQKLIINATEEEISNLKKLLDLKSNSHLSTIIKNFKRADFLSQLKINVTDWFLTIEHDYEDFNAAVQSNLDDLKNKMVLYLPLGDRLATLLIDPIKKGYAQFTDAIGRFALEKKGDILGLLNVNFDQVLKNTSALYAKVKDIQSKHKQASAATLTGLVAKSTRTEITGRRSPEKAAIAELIERLKRQQGFNQDQIDKVLMAFAKDAPEGIEAQLKLHKFSDADIEKVSKSLGTTLSMGSQEALEFMRKKSYKAIAKPIQFFFVEGLPGMVKAAITDIGNASTAISTSFIGKAAKFVGSQTGKLIDVIAKDVATGLGPEFMNAIATPLHNLGIRTAVLLNKISLPFGRFFGKDNPVSIIFNKLSTIVESKTKSITNFLDTVKSQTDVKSFSGVIFSKTKEFIDAIGKVLTNAGTALQNPTSIWTSIKNFFSRVGGFFSNLFNKPVETIEQKQARLAKLTTKEERLKKVESGRIEQIANYPENNDNIQKLNALNTKLTTKKELLKDHLDENLREKSKTELITSMRESNSREKEIDSQIQQIEKANASINKKGGRAKVRKEIDKLQSQIQAKQDIVTQYAGEEIPYIYKDYETDISKHKTEISKLQDMLDVSRRESNKSKIDELTTEISTLEERLRGVSPDVNELVARRDNLYSQKESLEAKFPKNDEKLKEIKAFVDQKHITDQEILESKINLQNLQKTHQEKRTEFGSATSRVVRENLQKEIEELNKQIQKLPSEIAEKEAKNTQLQKQLQDLENSMVLPSASQKQEVDAITKELAEISDQLKNVADVTVIDELTEKKQLLKEYERKNKTGTLPSIPELEKEKQSVSEKKAFQKAQLKAYNESAIEAKQKFLSEQIQKIESEIAVLSELEKTLLHQQKSLDKVSVARSEIVKKQEELKQEIQALQEAENNLGKNKLLGGLTSLFKGVSSKLKSFSEKLTDKSKDVSRINVIDQKDAEANKNTGRLIVLTRQEILTIGLRDAIVGLGYSAAATAENIGNYFAEAASRAEQAWNDSKNKTYQSWGEMVNESAKTVIGIFVNTDQVKVNTQNALATIGNLYKATYSGIAALIRDNNTAEKLNTNLSENFLAGFDAIYRNTIAGVASISRGFYGLSEILEKVDDDSVFKNLATRAAKVTWDIGVFFSGSAMKADTAWQRARNSIIGQSWWKIAKAAIKTGIEIVASLNHGAADKTAEAWERTEESATDNIEAIGEAANDVSQQIDTSTTKTTGFFSKVFHSIGGIGQAGIAVGGAIAAIGFAAQSTTGYLASMGIVSQEQADSIDQVMSLFEQIGIIGGTLTPILSALFASFGAFGTIGGTVATAISGIGTAIAGLMGISSIGLVPLLLGIGAIATAVGGLYFAFKTNFLGITSLANWIGSKITSALSGPISFIEGAWQGFVDRFGSKLMPVIQPALDIAQGLINALNHNPTEVIPLAWELAVEKIKGFLDLLLIPAKAIGNLLNNVLSPVAGFFKEKLHIGIDKINEGKEKLINVKNSTFDTAKGMNLFFTQFDEIFNKLLYSNLSTNIELSNILQQLHKINESITEGISLKKEPIVPTPAVTSLVNTKAVKQKSLRQEFFEEKSRLESASKVLGQTDTGFFNTSIFKTINNVFDKQAAFTSVMEKKMQAEEARLAVEIIKGSESTSADFRDKYKDMITTTTAPKDGVLGLLGMSETKTSLNDSGRRYIERKLAKQAKRGTGLFDTKSMVATAKEIGAVIPEDNLLNRALINQESLKDTISITPEEADDLIELRRISEILSQILNVVDKRLVIPTVTSPVMTDVPAIAPSVTETKKITPSLLDHVKDFSSGIVKSVPSLLHPIQAIGSGIINSVPSLLGGVKDFSGGIIQNTGNAINQTFNKSRPPKPPESVHANNEIPEWIKNIGEKLNQPTIQSTEPHKTGLDKYLEARHRLASNAIETTQKAVAGLGGKANEVLAGASKLPIVSGFKENVKGLITNLAPPPVPAASVGDMGAAQVKEAWATTTAAISGDISNLVAIAGVSGYELQKSVAEGSPGPTFYIRQYWSQTIDAIQKWLGSLLPKAAKAANDLTSSVSDAATSATKLVGSSVSSFQASAIAAVVATTQEIQDRFAYLQSTGGTNLDLLFAPGMEQVGEHLSALSGDFIDFGKRAAIAILHLDFAGLASAVGDFSGNFGFAIKGILAGFKDMTASAIAFGLFTLTSMSPVLLIGAGLAFTAAVILSNALGIRTILKGIFKVIIGVDQIFGSLLNGIISSGKAIRTIFSGISAAINGDTTILKAGLKELEVAFLETVSGIGKGIEIISQGFVKVLSGISEGLIQIFTPLEIPLTWLANWFDSTKVLVKSFWNLLKTDSEAASYALADMMITQIKAVITGVQSFFNLIGKLLTSGKDQFVDFTRSITKSALEGITNFIAYVKEINFKTLFSDSGKIKSIIIKIFKDIPNIIYEQILKVGTAIETFFSDLLGISSGFTKGFLRRISEELPTELATNISKWSTEIKAGVVAFLEKLNLLGLFINLFSQIREIANEINPFAKTVIEWQATFTSVINTVEVSWNRLVEWLGKTEIMPTGLKALQSVGTEFVILMDKIGAGWASLQVELARGDMFAGSFQKIRDGLIGIFDFLPYLDGVTQLKNLILDALNLIEKGWGKLSVFLGTTPIIPIGIDTIANLGKVFTNVITYIKTQWEPFVIWLNSTNLFGNIFNGLRAGIEGLPELITKIGIIFDALPKTIGNAVDWISDKWQAFTNQFSEILKPIVTFALNIAQGLINALNHNPTVVIPIAWAKAVDLIKQMIKGLIDTALSVGTALVKALSGRNIFKAIDNGLQNTYLALVAFQQKIQELKNNHTNFAGIFSFIDNLINVLKSLIPVADSILNIIKQLIKLGIKLGVALGNIYTAFVNEILPIIINKLPEIELSFKKIFNIFQKLLVFMVDLTTYIVKITLTNLPSFFETLGKVLQTLEPIIISILNSVVSLVAALIKMLPVIITIIAKVSAPLLPVIRSILQVLLIITSGIPTVINGLIGGIKIISPLISMLSNLLIELSRSVILVLSKVGEFSSGFLKGFLFTIKPALESLGSAITAFLKITNAAEAAATAFVGVIAYLLLRLSAITTPLQVWLSLGASIFKAVAAATGFLGVIEFLVRIMNDFLKQVSSVETLGIFIGTKIGEAISIIIGGIKNLILLITGIRDAIAHPILAFQTLGKTVGDILTAISGIGAINGLTVLDMAIRGLIAWLDTSSEKIKSIGGLYNAAFALILDGATNLFQFLSSSIKVLHDNLISIRDALAGVTNIVGTAWEKTGNKIGQVFDKLRGKSKKTGDDIQHDIAEGSPGLTSWIRDCWGKTGAFIENTLNSVANTAINAGEAAAGGMGTTLNAYKTRLTEIEQLQQELDQNYRAALSSTPVEKHKNITDKYHSMSETLGKHRAVTIGHIKTLEKHNDAGKNNIQNIQQQVVVNQALAKTASSVQSALTSMGTALSNISPQLAAPLYAINDLIDTFTEFKTAGTQIQDVVTSIKSLSQVATTSATATNAAIASTEAVIGASSEANILGMELTAVASTEEAVVIGANNSFMATTFGFLGASAEAAWSSLITPIIPFLPLIIGVAAGLFLLYQAFHNNFLGITTLVTDAIGLFKYFFTQIFGGIWKAIASIFFTVGQEAGAIIDTFKQIGFLLIEPFLPLMKMFGITFNGSGNGGFFAAAIDLLVNLILTPVRIIASVINFMIRLLGGIIQSILWIGAAVLNFVLMPIRLIVAAIMGVVYGFQTAGRIIQSAFKWILLIPAEIALGLTQSITGFIGQIAFAIKNIVLYPFRILFNNPLIGQVFSTIYAGIVNVANILKPIVGMVSVLAATLIGIKLSIFDTCGLFVNLKSKLAETVKNIEALKDTWDKVADFIPGFPAFDDLMEQVLKSSDVLEKFIDFTESQWSQLTKYIKDTPIGDIFNDLTSSAMDFVKSALPNVIEAVKNLPSTFTSLKSQAAPLLENVFTKIGTAAASVLPALTTVWESIVAGASGVFAIAMPAIEAIMAALAPFAWIILGIGAAIALLYVGVTTNFLGIRTILTIAISPFIILWNVIKTVASGIWDILTGIFGNLVTQVEAVWTTLVNTISSVLTPIQQALSSIFGNLFGGSDNALIGFLELIGKLLGSLILIPFQLIGFVLNAIITSIGLLLQGIILVGGAILSVFTIPFIIASSVIEFISTTISSIFDTIIQVGTVIVNAFLTPFQAVWDTVQWIGTEIKSWQSWLSNLPVVGWFFQSPQAPDQTIQAFAEGGIVQGQGTSTGDRVMAMVSPGEYVVNAGATSKYMGLLEAINAGELPSYSALTAMPDIATSLPDIMMSAPGGGSSPELPPMEFNFNFGDIVLQGASGASAAAEFLEEIEPQLQRKMRELLRDLVEKMK